MDEKIKVTRKNNLYELKSLPKRKTTIGVRWINKVKTNAKGEQEIYKARLMAKSYKLTIKHPLCE